MRYTLNPEGLTFEEWVCAAGVASFDQGLTRPYTSSETVYHVPPPCEEVKPRVLWLVNGIVVPKHEPKRYTHTHYPKKVRDAWKAGEDPTEWRA